jgi:hypothetical protein
MNTDLETARQSWMRAFAAHGVTVTREVIEDRIACLESVLTRCPDSGDIIRQLVEELQDLRRAL